MYVDVRCKYVRGRLEQVQLASLNKCSLHHAAKLPDSSHATSHATHKSSIYEVLSIHHNSPTHNKTSTHRKSSTHHKPSIHHDSSIHHKSSNPISASDPLITSHQLKVYVAAPKPKSNRRQSPAHLGEGCRRRLGLPASFATTFEGGGEGGPKPYR